MCFGHYRAHVPTLDRYLQETYLSPLHLCLRPWMAFSVSFPLSSCSHPDACCTRTMSCYTIMQSLSHLPPLSPVTASLAFTESWKGLCHPTLDVRQMADDRERAQSPRPRYYKPTYQLFLSLLVLGNHRILVLRLSKKRCGVIEVINQSIIDHHASHKSRPFKPSLVLPVAAGSYRSTLVNHRHSILQPVSYRCHAALARGGAHRFRWLAQCSAHTRSRVLGQRLARSGLSSCGLST